MDVGILAPAVVGQFLFRQQGQQLFHKLRLGLGLDQVDGVPVEVAYILAASGTEVTPAQDLEDAVAHVGQAQIGNGVDFLLIQIHFEVIFHRFPRFTRNWAQKPVKVPEMMLATIIIGK